MDSPSHKYYCGHCHRDLCADSPALLATLTNRHNALIHPADFANWKESGIVMSAQYKGPSTKPVAGSPVARVRVCEITASDKEWLQSMRVQWP